MQEAFSFQGLGRLKSDNSGYGVAYGVSADGNAVVGKAKISTMLNNNAIKAFYLSIGFANGIY